METDKHLQNAKGTAFCALILAAGYSSRMGDFKPLLPIGGIPAVKHITGAFREAGIENIIVVTGYKRELISPVLKEEKVAEAFNKDFSEGMFGSIKTGISAGIEACKINTGSTAPLSAFLMAPVDSPLVPAEIILRLTEEHMKNPEAFIVPCYHGKKGHPLLIPALYTDEILSYQGDRGLKGITSRYDEKMIRLETNCEAVVLDMDTPEGYEEMLRKFSGSGRTESDLLRDLSGRRLFLVRHGEIRQHKEKIFLGQYDTPLSEKGRCQAAAAGSQLAGYDLKTEKIYTSDLIRAEETADIIAETLHQYKLQGASGAYEGKRPEIIKDPGLREMSLGGWDGRFISEIRALYPDLYEKRGKDILSFKFDNDSENFYDLRYRVAKSVKKILSEDCKGDIVIVAHSGVIKVLQSAIWGTDILDELKKPVGNGQVKLLQPFCQ